LKDSNTDIYEKFIEISFNKEGEKLSDLGNLINYLSVIDKKNKQPIIKKPINNFIKNAMLNIQVSVDEKINRRIIQLKQNCSNVCL